MLVKPFIAKRARIEMVPLIDMFFLLLVFFIFGVFSMTMQHGVLVELPAAATAVATREEAVTISVTAEGDLVLERQPLSLETLAAALRERQALRPDLLVLINADRQAQHGVVMSVLDAVRQAGLQRVSLQAQPAP